MRPVLLPDDRDAAGRLEAVGRLEPEDPLTLCSEPPRRGLAEREPPLLPLPPRETAPPLRLPPLLPVIAPPDLEPPWVPPIPDRGPL